MIYNFIFNLLYIYYMHADLLTILRCYCGYRVKTRLSRIISQDHERRCAILVYHRRLMKLLIGNRIYLLYYGKLCYEYHNIPLELIISESYYSICYDKCEIRYGKFDGITIVYKFMDIYCLYISTNLYDRNNYNYMTLEIRVLYNNKWSTIYKNILGVNIYHEFRDIIKSRIKLMNIKN